MEKVRVRFAPSPTGPLHIGGVRTALYTYIFAKKHNGVFVLRIEDTDQTRYVKGAEKYILESLKWCGIIPDEGPGIGGNHGPYRQSERKEIYQKYVKELIGSGHAYYAFDSAEELEEMRTRLAAQGNKAPKYDHSSRLSMKNSLTLPPSQVDQLLENSENVVVRLKIEAGEEIVVTDLIRGKVSFKSDELDDKILLKADGMPTYHMANIVDDHLMEISHVIRGEEWLSSTAHHVLLYRALGWENEMPAFAHLPLILKPNGKGKLSKRDGAKFGFPVFPLSWESDVIEDSFIGFKEFGFDPDAVVNFLAFLGWNPGTEQEIFSLEGLSEAFSLEQIVKSGARFDIDKAKWFNQQYIISKDDISIAHYLKEFQPEIFASVDINYLAGVSALMKERVELYSEFYPNAKYFFEEVEVYEEKMIRKKWQAERKVYLKELLEKILDTDFSAQKIKELLQQFLEQKGLKFGDVLPFLRLGLSGTMKGPDVFEMMSLLGKQKVKRRLNKAWDNFDSLKENV